MWLIIGDYGRIFCCSAKAYSVYSYDSMALPKASMLGRQRIRYAENTLWKPSLVILAMLCDHQSHEASTSTLCH